MQIVCAQQFFHTHHLQSELSGLWQRPISELHQRASRLFKKLQQFLIICKNIENYAEHRSSNLRQLLRCRGLSLDQVQIVETTVHHGDACIVSEFEAVSLL